MREFQAVHHFEIRFYLPSKLYERFASNFTSASANFNGVSTPYAPDKSLIPFKHQQRHRLTRQF
jgi:hypothetical protein